MALPLVVGLIAYIAINSVLILWNLVKIGEGVHRIVEISSLTSLQKSDLRQFMEEVEKHGREKGET